MTPSFRRLAWATALATFLLVVLGAVVRITGSGMGCGDHWPLCNGHLIPPLSDYRTVLEWGHRLVAGLVSILVFGLAGYAWWQRRGVGGRASGVPDRTPYVAVALLIFQVLLGAVTVKLELPHWTVVLHLATAMVLLAAVLRAADGWRGRPARAATGALALGFFTVLAGGLTAKLDATAACLGFPLCNGQWMPAGDVLQSIHWTHRLLAYGLTAYVVVWAARGRRTGPWLVLGLVALQVAVGAGMVLGGFSLGLRAAHVAAGTAVWAGLVLAALRSGAVAALPPTVLPAPPARR
jgi:heme A synthase